ncbi:MAG: ketoacyl-ACP synthase III [Victivallales bacterium]|nr:ketoacyl-ACP synthase III [Victivallales bacterium]
MGIRIAGTGSYVPEKILTNFDLEKMVETSDEWIRTRTGMKERHIAAPDQACSDLASQAALNALDMAGLTADELDFLIVATITNDKVFPSTACIVQRKIGASNAGCLDIEAACSGLLYGMELASGLIRGHKKGKYRNILVIGSEKLSNLVDWEDRNTCVLFGDGASALILQATDDDDDLIVASEVKADGNYGDILQIPAGGSACPTTHETLDKKMHYMQMAGQDVFKQAVPAMVGSCKNVLAQAGVSPDEVAWLVPHQANFRIMKAVASRVGIPEERVYINIEKYGNTSAATVGLCLDEMVRGNQVKPGDYLLLTAFGGGLTWASVLLKWC